MSVSLFSIAKKVESGLQLSADRQPRTWVKGFVHILAKGFVWHIPPRQEEDEIQQQVQMII